MNFNMYHTSNPFLKYAWGGEGGYYGDNGDG